MSETTKTITRVRVLSQHLDVAVLNNDSTYSLKFGVFSNEKTDGTLKTLDSRKAIIIGCYTSDGQCINSVLDPNDLTRKISLASFQAGSLSELFLDLIIHDLVLDEDDGIIELQNRDDAKLAKSIKEKIDRLEADLKQLQDECDSHR